jgi:L-Ala-D/L-Glu epimerase / N-acetyl-D-glutamate racemase
VQVDSFELHPIRIPFRRSFTHARHERTETRAVIVVLRSADGIRGCGEILPRDYVTGETTGDVLSRVGPSMGARLAGRRFADIGDVLAYLRGELDQAGRNLATFCGFETALLDVAGQTFGVGLGDILDGPERPALPASAVIGFDLPTTSLARHAAVMRLRGTRHVKVKVGLPDDVERLSILADGVRVPLRIDANAAWTSAAEAISRIRAMRAIPLASVEQPLPPQDTAGARRVREETGLPVVADEALCTWQDAERLISERAADIFNIRIAKCGGILGSRRIVERARKDGLRCQLGTLVGETGILTRVAEVLGRHLPGFEWLDGKGQNASLLEYDVLDDPGEAVRAPASAPGLGVHVSGERLRRASAVEPV